ncbi:unnamed protein product, partial [Owenia fusiformis]
ALLFLETKFHFKKFDILLHSLLLRRTATANMPENAKVYIHYGPYDSCGLVEHRDLRLKGLQNVLQLHGHTVELKEINDWNVIELWVNGELIFTCDIRELEYGGDGHLDPLCSSALQKVTEAY